ncbi:hypothetical protein JOC73_002891 [Alkaliphilus hydrothermalis]|uniref:Recombinase zinc beta ribbon domain-containing protein n=1 Tax=Alkaliphilus hydrothermalis TaxID=1482730 RepID=A0ABS2NTJ9_9FIRM|nr:hypothetical protein [Alkaliphilus hydrothermalis]
MGYSCFEIPQYKRSYSTRISNYPFKGLLKCSSCEDKNKSIYLSGNYYSCSTNKCTRIKKEVLINALLRRLLEDILDEERIKLIISDLKKNLEKDIKTKRSKLYKNQKDKESNLLGLITDPRNTTISEILKELIDNEKRIIEEISNLEDRLSNLDNVLVETAKIRELGSNQYIIINYLINELPLDSLQERLHSFIEQIELCGSTKQYNTKEIGYGR